MYSAVCEVLGTVKPLILAALNFWDSIYNIMCAINFRVFVCWLLD